MTPEQLSKNVSSYMRWYRDANGQTQADLSVATGIATPHICHYETCYRVPSVHNLIKLAKAMDAKIDDIVYNCIEV